MRTRKSSSQILLALSVAALAVGISISASAITESVVTGISLGVSFLSLFLALASFVGNSKAVTTSPWMERASQVQIIDEVAQIERAARGILKNAPGEHRSSYPTVASLVPDLVRAGVWSERDAEEFMQVMRIRNRVAHAESVSTREARSAATSAERLLAKINDTS